ncbi:MAG: potassium-transporting ATPase subunit KdpA [Candidatus Eremiobacteraeota bacterium]|nr:potassium-transporting ATPase subunit KdpA [Candidatus Eremiobacteraeota bacterium]
MLTVYSWLEAALLFLVLYLAARPLGAYIEAVFDGRPTIAGRVLAPVERALYRACRIDPAREMHWKAYAFALLAFSFTSVAFTYAALRLQAFLPLNPQGFAGLAPGLAWNTAVSFATTTDWQFYSGESTMGYGTQMAVLAWQNFVAAGTGLAVAIALMRGFARGGAETIGNFWTDLTRGILYVLLPLSVLFGLAFLVQGVPQNFHPYLDVTTLDGGHQTITGGPMASQESIKLLGGNGGGFVSANSTSPNENPTGISNFLQLLAMFLVPAALTFTFGAIVRDRRQGFALFWAMSVLFFAGVACATPAETGGNPLVHALGVAGPNLEGKEARFGANDAGLSLAVATDSTVGASNFTYDSLTPLAGLVALVNMQLGEVAFGGVGSGIFGMLAFVVLTVFIAGLMVGRTPEYVGNKLERREILFVLLALLSFPIAILVPAAIAAVAPAGLATLGNSGPHGFSELFYAFTSSAASNGSAMAGLGTNDFYDVATGLAMLAGRYAAIVPTLALAGVLARKPRNDRTAGTLRTDTPLFVVLLVATIAIVGALTFVPGDALGPIVEHVLLQRGTTS